MGTIIHRTLVVVTFDDAEGWRLWKECLDRIKDKEGLPSLLTPLMPGESNGYASFAVMPAGSKEGWDTQAADERSKDAVLEVLVEQAEKWRFNYALVEMHPDHGTRVTEADDL